MRIILISLVASLILGRCALAQEYRLFSVGTGDLFGGYYAVTRAICDAINRAEQGRFRCSPEATPGSVYNLLSLKRGQLDLAIVQSDWQRHAFNGTAIFSRSPIKQLRSVMSLNPEAFNLIVRRQTGIASVRDLVGKRVDLGPPSSGRRGTIESVLKAFGIKNSQFRFITELPGSDAISALCEGKIDATVLITGHPRAAITRALNQCDARLVSISGPEIDRMISRNSDYNRFLIPSQAYASLSADVATFAVQATVVTSSTMDEDAIEAFVLNTLANLESLRYQVPLLRALDVKEMRSAGLTAPLHPAAAGAFDNFFTSSK